jgi:TetR/AcrR family transcriptional regulator
VPRAPRTSRQAIIEAARAAFAAGGFAGTGVDDIARRAGVNKAMIYYHFTDKEHLYREIVREMFSTISARTTAIAASRQSPLAKIDAFIDTIAAEAGARPHMPPLMMREAAEGGRHLDPGTLRIMLSIFLGLRRILDEGVRSGALRTVDPVLMYFSLVGPIVMYLAGAKVRNAIGRLTPPRLALGESAALRRHLSDVGDVEAMRDHLKAVAREALERRGQPTRARATPASRRPASRSGAAN